MDATLNLSTLTAPSANTIRMGIRSSVGDYPPDATGACSTRDAQTALTGKPCARLRIITADRIESL